MSRPPATAATVCPVCLQRPVVGGGVDAAGEAGDHNQRVGKIGGEGLRHPLTVGRGVATTNKGNGTGRQPCGIAQDGDHRRRIVQQRKQRRVAGLACKDQPRPEPADGFQLARCIGGGRDDLRCLPASGAGEGRERVQRLGGGRVTGEQTPIRDRADTLGARKAQPVQRVGRCQVLVIMPSDQCVARCPPAGGGYSHDDG
jgi:hypothetical protein